MEKKYSLTLTAEFIKYCELNNIADVVEFAGKIFDKAFTKEKYGLKPKIKKQTEIELDNEEQVLLDRGIGSEPPIEWTKEKLDEIKKQVSEVVQTRTKEQKKKNEVMAKKFAKQDKKDKETDIYGD